MSSAAHVAWLRLSPRSGQNLDVSSLSFVADLGIEGDRHAKPDTRNQVLLMDTETLDALELAPGDIRENVATRGIDLASLREGDRLGIGAEAEVVISHPCDPCSQDGRAAARTSGGDTRTPGHARQRQRQWRGRCWRPHHLHGHRGGLTAAAHPGTGTRRTQEVA